MARLIAMVRGFATLTLWVAPFSLEALAAEGANSPPSLHVGGSGIDLTGMDQHVAPGDDFYSFANAAAVRAIDVPANKASWGSIARLIAQSHDRVRGLIEDASRDHGPSVTPRAQVGAFFRAYMNRGRVNRLGSLPLRGDLSAIRAAPNKAALGLLLGRENRSMFVSPITATIDVDESAPKRLSAHLAQAGLGLPSPDYYINSRFSAQKGLYQAYIERVLDLIGWAKSKASAAEIVAFETQVATRSASLSEQRDPSHAFTTENVNELARSLPGFPWRTFLRGEELRIGQITVVQKPTIRAIAERFAATRLSTLKAWSAFHLADRAAPYLSQTFVDASFSFHDAGLSGQTAQTPTADRAVDVVNDAIGDAVGKLYVDRYFSSGTKTATSRLAQQVRAAVRRRIQGAEWMDASTRVEALKKLDAMQLKIGYPDHWQDYSQLRVREGDLFGDVVRARDISWHRRVAQLARPADRAEWRVPPQTVQAGYDPVRNDVTFTAAILQPPFFDAGADAAVNFGAIGAVIGHEMTHGFDDQGRHYDAEGRLRDWWTKRAAASFEERAKRLVDQYNDYAPVPGGPHVNGQLTLGENIADLGGVLAAFDAYRAASRSKSSNLMDGFTGEQRFFLGWAQAWRSKVRNELVWRRLATNVHSPDTFRVNGVVRNIDAWYQAFTIPVSQKLGLPQNERATVW